MCSSFTVFGVTIYPYTLCMVGGAALCIVLFVVLSYKRRRDTFDENMFALEMLLVAVAAALPAAIFFDALFKLGENGGKLVLKGATFYGGLLGALALWPLLLLIKRKRRVSIYCRLCDLAPGIPAGHCLGRIGCFFGGCCFGAPTDGPFGVIFPEGSLPFRYYGGAVPIHPTQLYEAVALLIIFFILIAFGKKHAFPLYCMLYGAARFMIEWFRADDRGSIFGLPLSPAQIISIVLILFGEILLLAYLVRERKKRIAR